jgi:hypothetical protein
MAPSLLRSLGGGGGRAPPRAPSGRAGGRGGQGVLVRQGWRALRARVLRLPLAQHGLRVARRGTARLRQRAFALSLRTANTPPPPSAARGGLPERAAVGRPAAACPTRASTAAAPPPLPPVARPAQGPRLWPGQAGFREGGPNAPDDPPCARPPPPPLVHLAAIPAAAAAARRGESAPRRRRRRPPNFPIAKVDLDDPQSRKKLDLRLERYAHVPSRVLDWPERPRTSRGRRLFEPGLQGARAEREQQSICSTSRRPAQTRAR